MAARLMPRVLAVFMLVMMAACAGIPDENVSTFYLVRHAEKTPASVDPELTEKGKVRAEALADRLENASLTAIWSTDTTRTHETAAPVSARLGLPVLIYDASDLEDFAQRLSADGGRVLVVGHSNTTPELAALLGGDPGPPINEASEYDRLYVIQVEADTVKSERQRYGGRASHEGEDAK